MNASKSAGQDILAHDLFSGKTVFVTGGGSGINLGIARTFADLGANIGICGRSQERLDAAAAGLAELGAKVSATSADIRVPDQLQSAMNASRDVLGDIDILVCSAAGNFLVQGENHSFNSFRTIIDAHRSCGVIQRQPHCLRTIATTRGSIIFIRRRWQRSPPIGPMSRPGQKPASKC